MLQRMTGQQPADLPPDVAGPRSLVDRIAPLFPGSSLRAALPAQPIRYQWIRTGDFLEYQASGQKPPRMMVLALTDSELVLLDAHFRHGQVRLWRKFSRWASWPLGSLEADLADSSILPKLTIRVLGSKSTFPFTVFIGPAYRGTRDAVELIESAISAASATAPRGR
jgi:hypothetical protein